LRDCSFFDCVRFSRSAMQ